MEKGMFETYKHKKFVKLAISEARDFIDKLKICDSSELGLPVALAAHYKNEYARQGIDLSDPIVLQSVNPNVMVKLMADTSDFQLSDQQYLATGLVVWVISLRARYDLKLRALAREMWGQLERGFPYAEEAADAAFALNKIVLDISDSSEFPIGLTPKPL